MSVFRPPHHKDSLDKEIRRLVEQSARRKTNKSHSESVDKTEREWAARPPVGSNSLSGNQGPLSSRRTRKVGRSYYSPERIAERAVKRQDRYQRKRYGN